MIKRYAYIPIFLKTILFASLILSVSYVSYSQEEEERTADDYKKEFNDFSRGLDKKFKAFSDKNDSIFLAFLEGVWAEFEMFTIEKEIKPKPEEQPQFEGEARELNEIYPAGEQELIEVEEESKHSRQPVPELKVPEAQMAIPSMNINYYGTSIDLPRYDSQYESLKNPSQQQVSDFYKYLAENQLVQYSLLAFDNTAEELGLNGWGMFQLLKTASQKYFTDRNERTLFAWYAMLKLGIDARIGLNDKEVYLFAHTDAGIFNNSFIIFDDKKYYLLNIDDKPIDFSRIETYEADYPASLNPLTLKFNESPGLTENAYTRKLEFKGKDFELLVNYSLIDFYKSYPDCDLEVYFSAPLSAAAIASWDDVIGNEMDGLSEADKLNNLLSYVQYSFPYKIDENQFGKEKYMFAEEAIYYPFTDCEDRSVLLAQLIKHYTGLSVIGLSFPQHVAIGVHLDKDLAGDFVKLGEDRYYICDPTYIGATIGVGMDEFMNTEPSIIFID